MAHSDVGTSGSSTTAAVIDRDIRPDVDEYANSVAGVDIEAVRIGPSQAESHVLAVTGDRFTFTESQIGFAMLSRTTVRDDVLVICKILAAVPRSRWCNIPLEAEQVIVYAPAAEHLARNLPGLRFRFVTSTVEQIETHAAQLGARVDVPPRGQVHLLDDDVATSLVGPAFAHFAQRARSGAAPSAQSADDVLRSVVNALSGGRSAQCIGRPGRVDSRRVVGACIDYAQSVQCIPSISELCLVAHVSERRLREAFTEEYDMPPSRFFRAWALGEVRRRLAAYGSGGETVTRVASDLGFDHLGRFAGHYAEIFGERPSDTLRSAT